MFSLTLDIKNIDKTSIIKNPKSFQNLMLKNEFDPQSGVRGDSEGGEGQLPGRGEVQGLEFDPLQNVHTTNHLSPILGFIKIVTQ